MTATTIEAKKPPLWSPGLIFVAAFLLVWFNPFWAITISATMACVSWWRLRTRSGVAGYLVSVFGLILIWFTDYQYSSLKLLDSNWFIWSYVVRCAIVVLIGGYLAYAMNRTFDTLTGTEEVIWRWWEGPAVCLAILGLYVILMSGLNYLWKATGNCRLPTVYDIATKYVEPEREGVAGVLVGHADFGCGWRWMGERAEWSEVPDEPDHPVEYARGSMEGDYNGHFTMLYQRVWLFDQEVTSEMVASRFNPEIGEVPFSPEITENYGSTFEQIYCSEYFDEVKKCTVVTGYKRTILQFTIMSGISEAQFEETIETLLARTGERISAYEMNQRPLNSP